MDDRPPSVLSLIVSWIILIGLALTVAGYGPIADLPGPPPGVLSPSRPASSTAPAVTP